MKGLLNQIESVNVDMNKILKSNLIARPGEVYDYTEITGHIYASGADTKTAFPKLTSVGGGIYASGADTKTAFPKLTSVGGGIDASGANHIKQNDQETVERCAAMLESSFAKSGFSFADKVLARIVSMRGRVLRVVVCGKTKTSYLVTDGSAWSHGDTLAEARDGLLYKIGSRDTTEFKSWTLDLVVSKRTPFVLTALLPEPAKAALGIGWISEEPRMNSLSEKSST